MDAADDLTDPIALVVDPDSRARTTRTTRT